MTEALVLRRIPYADTSLVVHLFTPGRGRVAALAKGAFRPTSPHFASLDLLDRVEARVLGRREGGLALLGETTLLDDHRRMRTRTGALAAAFYTAELLDAALTEAAAPRLYQIAVSWLERLDAEAPPGDDALAVGLAGFELAFLDEIGLRPVLDRCAECAGELGSGPRFACSASAGGAICGACGRASRDAVTISGTALAGARAMLDGCAPASLSVADVRDLRGSLDRFHAYHLDRVPRSRPSLERIHPRR